MAFDFSKLNFFSRLDARARVVVLIAGVLGFVFLVYLGTRYLTGGAKTVGPSNVAAAPQGLQSVPGGQLTPEYQRVLEQANLQRAKQAQVSGTSAVSTMINYGAPASGSGCVICADQSSNIKYALDDWVRQGKIAPEVAAELEDLANKNVPVSEFEAALDRLVKEGKLTPEQARELLERYKKQHGDALLKESANAMDALIKSGQLPLDVANELLDMQKKNVSPAEYAAKLAELVREGKISPQVAAQLLAQYTQQRAKEIILRSLSSLQQMAKNGQLTTDVLNTLIDLEKRMVPLNEFTDTVQKLVTAGKMVPAVAKQIVDEYTAQKKEIGSSAAINQLVEKLEKAAYAEINDLVKAGRMSQDVGNLLSGLIQKNVSFQDYQTAVNQLVLQKKLTPDIATLKLDDYRRLKGMRDMAQRLFDLQANNASPASYMDELKRAVQEGLLTPEQAAQLMQEYQALKATPGAPGGALPLTGAGAEAFAKLQQAVQKGAAVPTAPPPAEFAAAQAQAAQESAQDRQARISALMSAMAGQAQQLVASWQPPTMLYREGSPETAKGGGKKGGTGATGKEETTQTGAGKEGEAMGPVIIKAGDILFAVLDTAVNSDYPDSPVMATIVEGKYKGAKLMGKLATAKNVAGQLDRVSLNFTIMNTDEWNASKSVTAYAIDPDTARTVMASQVNYHYLKRFGAIMATSFLQGYATSITNAGTSTTGIFGTSTTHPALATGQKIMVGLGQVGQTLGNEIQGYINIPPTVRVDSGVGLGILFMSDVS